MSHVDSVSLDDLESSEESFGELEFDEVMSISSEDQFSAENLVLDTNSWIVWETLHGCQEGIFGDVPHKYHDALAIFEAEDPSQVADDSCEHLMKVAGATGDSEQPWSLPAPLFRISPEDALLQSNVRVLQVSHMTPAAAVYFTPDPCASSCILDIASPLLLPTKPIFASAVCTSSSQLLASSPPFSILRRHNRLATTSALRQAHALHMDLPVIGILFRRREVAIHMDWYEDKDGQLYVYSAFYSTDPNDMEPKVWNLDLAADVQRLLCIFSRLRTYTHTRLAERVREGLSSLPQHIRPWKWDPLTLPSAPIVSQDAEFEGEEMGQWRKSWHREAKQIHVNRMSLEHIPPTPEYSF